jgi:molybdate transport system ATP-binding protein
MRQIHVAYGDRVVLTQFDWRIESGQHWQVTGANGSGKTTLLELITGDSPHCYTNDLTVFGYKRGTGESIWQIKQYIGLVSSALHMAYRVSSSLENVLVSGFFDSIGVYQKPSEAQRQIVGAWLQRLGLDAVRQQPFNQQSYGNQRLLLIARAMIKQPALLILDEPCLGLDAPNRALVLALIEQLIARAQTTVIYVSHDARDRVDSISNTLALS